MSYVTNVILAFCALSDEDELLALINKYFTDEPGFNLVNNEGGAKGLEVRIATAAFRAFYPDDFIEYLKKIEWEQKETHFVQLFISKQGQPGFYLFDIFNSGDWW